MKIYVIMEIKGEYEDKITSIVSAYKTKDEAEKEQKYLNDNSDMYEELRNIGEENFKEISDYYDNPYPLGSGYTEEDINDECDRRYNEDYNAKFMTVLYLKKHPNEDRSDVLSAFESFINYDYDNPYYYITETELK